VAVAGVALRGSADETAVTGAAGLAVTAAGGGVARGRRHRGEHRAASYVATSPAEPAVGAEPATAAQPTAPTAWAPAASAPSLVLVPSLRPGTEAMTDTVPHSVVKLFPLAQLEPELAAGTIDERVYAAIDEERRQAQATALASGRHASPSPTDAALPRDATYSSRHSA
jgi:hypothetical protein